MNHDTVAHEARFVHTVYLAFGDKRSGNRTDLRYLVYLAYLNLAGDDLFFHLVEHSFHCRAYIFDGIVDDGVGVDLHSVAVGQLACGRRRPYLEAHDDGI